MAALRLNSGSLMPAIALGTYKLQGEVCTQTVQKALVEAGYRHIDTAAMYQNEAAIGAGLSLAYSQGVNRQDVFLTTKLWCNDYAAEKMRPALQRSLEGLGVDYLDLYMLHYPFAVTGCETYPPANPALEPIPMHQVWARMEEFVAEGLVKHIGVCNWPASMLLDTLSYSHIKPAVNQIEVHPYNPQRELVSFCQRNGVICSAFGTLGGVDYDHLALAEPLLSHPIVQELAQVYGKSPAQVLIAWTRSRGLAVVVKGSGLKHLRENLEAGNVHLSEEEVEKLSNLDRGLRFYARGFYKALNFPLFA